MSFSLPPPRDFGWTMKPVPSAVTAVDEPEDGRMVISIKHDVVAGVTPEMILWWFSRIDRPLVYRGERWPAYLVWHPRDHHSFQVERRGPGDLPRPGDAIRIREKLGRDDRFAIDQRVVLEQLDTDGIAFSSFKVGIRLGRLQHRWRRVAGGTQYDSCLTLGLGHPWLAWPNRILRPRLFSREKAQAWLRHNVEEVGNFEHFLAELYQREGTAAAKAR